MNPILYAKGASDFSTNGKGRLSDAASVTWKQERNGIYDIEIEYPINGTHYAELAAGAVVGIVTDSDTVQGFDIYGHSAPFEGFVTFYGHHVSYRLRNVIIKPFTAVSCADTIAKLPLNAVTPCEFTFWTDKDVGQPFALKHPDSVWNILRGQEGSILDVYGKGDYEFDNFAVKLWTDRGQDRGVKISYGRNLTGGEQEISTDETFNAIAPYWTQENEDGTTKTVYLDGIYVHRDSVVDAVPVPMDFSAEFETEPTKDQLRDRAVKYLDDNEPWNPDESVTLEYSELWGKKIALCDRITASYPDLGLYNVKQKVITLEGDAFAEKITAVGLGNPYKSYASEIAESIDGQINSIRSAINGKVGASGVEEIVLTSARVQTRIDGIITSATKDFTRRSETETVRNSLQSQVTQLADSVEIGFDSTNERVTTLEGTTETEFNTIHTFFRFVPTTQQQPGGLFVGESTNEYKSKYGADGVYIYKGADSNATEQGASSYWKHDVFVAGNALQIGAHSAPVHWQLKALRNGDLAIDRF